MLLQTRIMASLFLCATLLLAGCGGAPAATQSSSIAPTDSSLHQNDTQGNQPTTAPAAAAPTEAPAAEVLAAAPTEAPASEPLAAAAGTAKEQPYGSTYFQNYGVNPFVDPQDDPLSTFGMDVDTAAYGVMRRFISDGHLPDPDSVRVEEYLNSFNYRYPQPGKQDDFAIYTEAAPSPFGGKDYDLLQVGIQTRTIADAERKPASLTFVVDVSGSMSQDDRLGTVKEALKLLVHQLRADDRIAIVVYGSTARLVLPSTSGTQKQRILDALSELTPTGATNVEAGLDIGFAEASRDVVDGNNLILLCSDGVANNGVTDPAGLLEKYRAYTDQGIRLATFGFGMGNYNDVLMEALADHGNGFYRYIDSLDEAKKVFVDELTGTLQVVARDAKIQVEFDPELVKRYRLVGYENRDVADHDFRNDHVDAGEVGAGQSVTALYEIQRQPGAAGKLATVRIRYQHASTDGVLERAHAVDTGEIRPSSNDTTARFRLAASVAAYAELLRHGRWATGTLTDEIVVMARDAARTFESDPDIEEYVRLLEAAQRLAPDD